MKRIEYNGRNYYYDGKYFFDESFIVLDGEELKNVARMHFESIEYRDLEANELIEEIKQMKAHGLYYEARKMIDFSIKQKVNDIPFLRVIAPIYMSCLREAKQPQKAIEFAEKVLPICGGSSATYTSLAAAYCDIKDYEKAKKFARIAYAKQGGGQGYTTEASLVFKRIEKELGEELYTKEEDTNGHSNR